MIRYLTATMLLMVAAPQLAQASGSAVGGRDAAASLVPLILIMVIFYFLLILPQQKRYKAHQKMIDELKKGDRVITGGGVYGKVVDVQEEVLKVEIADGVRVRVKRDTISALVE